MLKNKTRILKKTTTINRTIVAALNAEPKSIPITCPDDVSIRKLNK
jgi:hypothetical protein